MLAQLICLDRRYQRMNCFNIRELQTLLKNRYHPELLDEKTHTYLLSQTVLNTRFKLFNLSSINPRMSLFNEYPIFSILSNNPTRAQESNLERRRPYGLTETYTFNHLVNLFFTSYSYYFDKAVYYYYLNPIVTPFYQFYVSSKDLKTVSTNISF